MTVLQVCAHSDSDFHSKYANKQHEEGQDHARTLLYRTAAAEEGDHKHDGAHNNQQDGCNGQRVICNGERLILCVKAMRHFEVITNEIRVVVVGTLDGYSNRHNDESSDLRETREH